jgi:hypothetical protein
VGQRFEIFWVGTKTIFSMRKATRSECARWKMKSHLRLCGARRTETSEAPRDEESERDTQALIVTIQTKEAIACFMTSKYRGDEQERKIA